jgi:hypothetical protein
VDSGVVVVTIFVLFYAVIAWIVRPRNRRKSRRPVALSAATDSPDPPFIERRRASIEPINSRAAGGDLRGTALADRQSESLSLRTVAVPPLFCVRCRNYRVKTAVLAQPPPGRDLRSLAVACHEKHHCVSAGLHSRLGADRGRVGTDSDLSCLGEVVNS